MSEIKLTINQDVFMKDLKPLINRIIEEELNQTDSAENMELLINYIDDDYVTVPSAVLNVLKDKVKAKSLIRKLNRGDELDLEADEFFELDSLIELGLTEYLKSLELTDVLIEFEDDTVSVVVKNVPTTLLSKLEKIGFEVI